MGKYLTPEQGFKLLQKGIKIEYLFEEDCWFPLYEDSPIRLLYENKIRISE